MFTHDPYAVKAVEYLTGIGFLVLFIMFWRFVNGEEPALARARAWSGQLAEWFRIPEQLLFHRGHGWARLDGTQALTLGIDDFAQQLVGRVERVELPPPGAELVQGQPGWTLHVGGKQIGMQAPVSGTVIGRNAGVVNNPHLVNSDPYGHGWLLRVKVPRAKHAVKGLFNGTAAREWIAKVSDDLMGAMSPELGHILQDGGLPIHGIARGIDEEHWDDVARKFLAGDE